jgi:hypothetical protein
VPLADLHCVKALLPDRLPDRGDLHRSVQRRRGLGGAIKTLVVICSGDWPTDERLEREMGKMWMDDLEGFPADVIEAAIGEFRRTEDRRPTPARIRKLCVKHAPRPPAPRFEPKTVEPSTEQKARIREMTGRAFLELRRFDETPTPRHPIHSGLE